MHLYTWKGFWERDKSENTSKHFFDGGGYIRFEIPKCTFLLLFEIMVNVEKMMLGLILYIA